MPSDTAIREAMSRLTAAGYPPPPAWAMAKEESRERLQRVYASARASWSVVLHDLSDVELMVVVDAWMARSQWWPRPAELRDLADRSMRAARAEAPALTGDDAWGRVLELVGRYGYYQGPPERLAERDDEHEALLSAIRAVGGWRRICGAEVGDMQVRAAFSRAFESAKASRQDGGAWSRQIEQTARAMLEQTRGDASRQIEQADARRLLREIEDRRKAGGAG